MSPQGPSDRTQTAQCRLNGLLRTLSTSVSFKSNDSVPETITGSSTTSDSGHPRLLGHLSIADITLPVFSPTTSPGRFPTPISEDLLRDSFTLSHLRWIAQKMILGQDVYLIAPTASCPYTRHLALGFCSLAQREYEYVAVHRDLGEAELKQAREISRSDQGSSNTKQLSFLDSAVVRAAKLGRVLILDGIEKAERGILPLLNNLLENREMNLEDGTHIIHPDCYESLSRQGLISNQLIPASRSFQVICIGVPIPPFIGYPLDPPFRSCFQVRYIDPLGASLALACPISSSPIWVKFKEVIMAIQLSNKSRTSSIAMSSGPPTLPNFPIPTLSRIKSLLATFPVSEPLGSEDLASLVCLLHPRLPHLSLRAWELLSDHLERAGLGPLKPSPSSFHPDGGGLFGYKLISLDRTDHNRARARFRSDLQGSTHTIIECMTSCGSEPLVPVTRVLSSFSDRGNLIGPRFEHLFHTMAQVHAIDSDIAFLPLPGQQASGSTELLINAFANVFGHGPGPKERLHLYREMTGKELVMRRTVSEGVTTGWAPSRLIKSARSGALIKVTAIDVIGSNIRAISSLLDGQAIELWGGRRMVPFTEFGDEPMVDVINPGFRVICTATKAGMGSGGGSARVPHWMLNDELGNVMMMVNLIGLSWDEETELMRRCGLEQQVLEPLSSFVSLYRELWSGAGKLKRLGTRGVLRLCNRLAKFPEEAAELGGKLKRGLLFDFLPRTERMDFEGCLERAGIGRGHEWDHLPPIISSDQQDLIFPSARTMSLNHEQDKKLNELRIPRQVSNDEKSERGLVPEMSWFFDNREQNGLIRNIGIDLMIMNQHLVLLGNQGVRKNKIVDRLLMLLGRPREYVQLHHDSTVQQLMFQTTVVNGTIQYLDSPLIRAVKFGRVLVVDEADKAPEHVTGVLKSLAKRSEMSLSDGRRIVREHRTTNEEIRMDEKFRMVLLANRPGYPFLGHQFLQVLGDGFGCYAIGNPDTDSEIELVSQLLTSNKLDDGKGVLVGTVEEQKMVVARLVKVFDHLRNAFDTGTITYPFSLRELLNLVRHLKAFPQDGLEIAMRNVFDFDVHRYETIDVVYEAMTKNGFKVGKPGIERIWQLEAQRALDNGRVHFVEHLNDQKKEKVDVWGDGDAQVEGGEMLVGDNDEGGDLDGDSWGGGVGAVDTSGMGARVGSKKILRRTNLYDMPDKSTKNAIPEYVRERARALSREELEKKLQDLSMRAGEVTHYGYYYKPVQAHIPQLVAILENLEATEKERVWVKRQSDGEMDDQRLVDGLIGESAIYKRRTSQRPEPGKPQLKPKRIRFVFDISSSMYRFQADGRLDRSCQTAIMIMEAFGLLDRPEKYVWDIVGHAGDSAEIELVPKGNESVPSIAERWKVVEKMKTFSQYAFAGDHTVEAIEQAVDVVADMDSDEAIVIAISDANFERYGITPEVLKAAMDRNKKVKTALIGIGEGSEVSWLPKMLPQQAYQVKESREIPIVLRSILSHFLTE